MTSWFIKGDIHQTRSVQYLSDKINAPFAKIKVKRKKNDWLIYLFMTTKGVRFLERNNISILSNIKETEPDTHTPIFYVIDLLNLPKVTEILKTIYNIDEFKDQEFSDEVLPEIVELYTRGLTNNLAGFKHKITPLKKRIDPRQNPTLPPTNFDKLIIQFWNNSESEKFWKSLKKEFIEYLLVNTDFDANSTRAKSAIWDATYRLCDTLHITFDLANGSPPAENKPASLVKRKHLIEILKLLVFYSYNGEKIFTRTNSMWKSAYDIAQEADDGEIAVILESKLTHPRTLFDKIVKSYLYRDMNRACIEFIYEKMHLITIQILPGNEFLSKQGTLTTEGKRIFEIFDNYFKVDHVSLTAMDVFKHELSSPNCFIGTVKHDHNIVGFNLYRFSIYTAQKKLQIFIPYSIIESKYQRLSIMPTLANIFICSIQSLLQDWIIEYGALLASRWAHKVYYDAGLLYFPMFQTAEVNADMRMMLNNVYGRKIEPVSDLLTCYVADPERVSLRDQTQSTRYDLSCEIFEKYFRNSSPDPTHMVPLLGYVDDLFYMKLRTRCAEQGLDLNSHLYYLHSIIRDCNWFRSLKTNETFSPSAYKRGNFLFWANIAMPSNDLSMRSNQLCKM